MGAAVSGNSQQPGSETRSPRQPGERQRRVRLVLLVILGLNVGVAVAKIVVGLLLGSLAMSADGVHSLMDGASNVIALIGIAIASRPPDRDHPYGHQRFETLTSLGIAAFMLLALFGILQGAWSRLQTGDVPEITALGFLVMGVTLAINIGVTTWERYEGRKLSSTVLMADARHTLTDVFVSVSVIASFILVEMGLGAADLIVSLVIAGFIAWGAWLILRDATSVLTDTAAQEPGDLRKSILEVSGVRGAHAIRSRSSEERVWVDLHIQVDPRISVDAGHEIASRVEQVVRDRFDLPTDVTVHVEPATGHHLRNVRRYERDEDVA